MLISILYFCTGLGFSIAKRIIKKKRFGKLVKIGKLKEKQLPIGPLLEMTFFLIYNSLFILIKMKEYNDFIKVLYIGSTVLICLIMLVEMIRNRSIVYVYEKE